MCKKPKKTKNQNERELRRRTMDGKRNITPSYPREKETIKKKKDTRISGREQST